MDVKSPEELIKTLTSGTLTTFWISEQSESPFSRKFTVVTKEQRSKIIELFLGILKKRNIIKSIEGATSGFCKSDLDLSHSVDAALTEKDGKYDIIAYCDNDEYGGICGLTQVNNGDFWYIKVGILCSVTKGTGTKILSLLKDAIRTQPMGLIELSPVESAVEFYNKMGFIPSQMVWFHNPSGGKKGTRKVKRNKRFTRKSKFTSS